MNLKEAFRYQNFLERMMKEAMFSISNKEHCLAVTKTHLRKRVNPNAEDMQETVDVEPFFKNDDVLRFMEWLVQERGYLTHAINQAKRESAMDMDAAIETNKFRQQVSTALKSMLRYTPRKSTERGCDFTFNNEGNQTTYYYDVDVESTEAFDRAGAKHLLRSITAESDDVSAQIDSVLVNSCVKYEPKYNVNESFEDVMDAFISHK